MKLLLESWGKISRQLTNSIAGSIPHSWVSVSQEGQDGVNNVGE